MGSSEHSSELRTHPLCTSLCIETCGALSLGIRRPPRLHTYRGAADSGATFRLWRRGVAVGWRGALCGPLHRRYVDAKAAAEVGGADNSPSPPPQTKKQSVGLLRLL